MIYLILIPEDKDECLEVDKQNGLALVYVREQTPELCLEGVKNNKIFIIYVRDLSMIEGVEFK